MGDASSDAGLALQEPLLPTLRVSQPRVSQPPPRVFSLVALGGSVVASCLTHLVVPLSHDGKKGAALFAFAACAWATEAAPAWTVGAALVPLATALGLPPRVSAKERAAANLGGLSDSIVFLILGSLSLGAALNVHGLDARLGAKLLKASEGAGPRGLVLCILLSTFALSALIGNACAAVAILLVVTPLVRAVPRSTNLPQACVAAVALGANIGGIITPSSSSQNAVAMLALTNLGCSISFASWVSAVGPLCVALLLVAWAALIAYWKPTGAMPRSPRSTSAPPLSWPQLAVIAIVCGTAAGWALFPYLQPVFGEIGLFSVLPLVLLFGSGLLKKPDLAKLDWSIYLLLGGGVCLGRAVGSSGAMDAAASSLRRLFSSASPRSASALFSLLPLIAANFLSHAVAALALLPLIADAAKAGHTAATVLASVCCDTCACALPVSSLPNLVAFASVDADGAPYLAVRDFVIVGLAFEAAAVRCDAPAGNESSFARFPYSLLPLSPADARPRSLR